MKTPRKTGDLPIAIIGAGPIGLAMAAHLVSCNRRFVVLEAGDEAGHSIREWQHVRLFTEWAGNIDSEADKLLRATGWQRPAADEIPAGGELLHDYLLPLARHPAIRPHLNLSHRVEAISRQGVDKVKTDGRAAQPFLLKTTTPAGERLIEASAVIDASGTWFACNPLHTSGLWTAAEQAAASQIEYGIPDVQGDARARYAGRCIAVVGAGYSAINVILDLAELRKADPATRISWVVRRANVDTLLRGSGQDLLLAQGWLGQRLRQLIERGEINVVPSFETATIGRDGEALLLTDGSGRTLRADRVVACTGFRPDLSLFRELRVDIDPVSESVRGLSALIDPNRHSCYSVPVHGLAELAHGEPDFFIIGIKSYGRAPTFLLKTGYEQARAIAAALCGLAPAERAKSSCAAE
jgi:2-polyprenyl-6-methoxyphenol hydroxylase-like FAD-dependent oxidoreductase